MGYPKNTGKKYSYADYLTWGDDERCEIIDGVIHDISAAPYTRHQAISGNLYSSIHNFLKGKIQKVFASPFDVRFPDENLAFEKTFTVVQPDICVFNNPSSLDERGGKLPPDWIIEILSPSTVTIDKVKKKELYAKHGVKEYWIIDPVQEMIRVFLLSDEKHYVHTADYRRNEAVASSLFPAFVINTEEIFSF